MIEWLRNRILPTQYLPTWRHKNLKANAKKIKEQIKNSVISISIHLFFSRCKKLSTKWKFPLLQHPDDFTPHYSQSCNKFGPKFAVFISWPRLSRTSADQMKWIPQLFMRGFFRKKNISLAASAFYLVSTVFRLL